jgi:hypothetical protein
MGPPKKFYCQETKKRFRSNPGRFVAVYQIGELFGKYQKAATSVTAANGCRATGFFLCDMNIFRRHSFLLALGNVDEAPVYYPALVKTSEEPSFCTNFSPFTSADAHQSSDISPVTNLN